MPDSATLNAEAREFRGKKAAKHLRQNGIVPAVVYGKDIQPVRCQVNQRTFEDLVHEHGRNAIITLTVEGDSQSPHSAIIKDLQTDPLRGDARHVDFHRIDLTERIVVEVPVLGMGTALGVKNDGGILEQRLHHLELECLPTAIPENIEVDVTELTIGHSIHVSDLTPPGDAFFVTEGERSVFVLVPPSVRKEDEEAEGEETEAEDELQEPEMVDERGKKEEDEEDDA